MIDSTDGKQLVDGTEENANSEGSNSNNSQQSSNAVSETAKQIQSLQKQVDALTRSLQSEKDKGIAKTNQRIDSLEKDLKKALQSAMQKGQSVQDLLNEVNAAEEAEARQAILEFAQAFRQGKTSGNPVLGGTEHTGVDVTSVLRELELDDNDLRVKEFRSRSFSSEAEAYREAARLQKTILTKQPSDADRPSPSGGMGAMSADKQQALRQEYESRSKDLRGHALVNLKMEMRKKGLREIN